MIRTVMCYKCSMAVHSSINELQAETSAEERFRTHMLQDII